MNWIKNAPPKEKEIDLLFTDGKMIYFGKKNFQNKWLDYEFGIVNDIVAWTDQIPEVPVFTSERAFNDDYKGWEHKTAPSNGRYVLVANKDSKINIAMFDSGWFDRKGTKLDDVLCSYDIPLYSAVVKKPK